MAIAGFSWINHVESGAIAASSEVATLPLANVQDQHGASIWRTTAATGVTVTLDLAAAKPIKVLMVAAASFSSSATWRLQLSTTAAHTGDIYDSGTLAMNRALIANKRSQACLVLSQLYSARYAKITFNDSGATQGYFDVGLLWLGDLWQPKFNFSWGAQLGLQDVSDTATSIGGQDYTNVREKYRQEQVTFNFLTDADYYSGVDQIDAIAGTARNVLWVPDPAGSYLNNQAMIGRVTELGPTSRAFVNGRSRSYKIKERL
jgi:hypothetical protein